MNLTTNQNSNLGLIIYFQASYMKNFNSKQSKQKQEKVKIQSDQGTDGLTN